MQYGDCWDNKAVYRSKSLRKYYQRGPLIVTNGILSRIERDDPFLTLDISHSLRPERHPSDLLDLTIMHPVFSVTIVYIGHFDHRHLLKRLISISRGLHSPARTRRS